MKGSVRQLLRDAGVDDETITQFLAWHRKHPVVYRRFEKVAKHAFLVLGMRRWSAGGIAEVVRYTMHKPGGADFVINNNYRAYYARILVARYPELRGRIKFRKVRGVKSIRKSQIEQKLVEPKQQEIKWAA